MSSDVYKWGYWFVEKIDILNIDVPIDLESV